MILQHLSLYQNFQFRRVSSKWKQVLSSPQVVDFLLRIWFPTSTVDTALHIPKGLSTTSVTSLKAEHINAYCTGQAFAYARYDSWDGFNMRLWLNSVAYADGIMAWIDSTDSDVVKLLDMKTGQKWSFLPEARTRIYAIALSSSMVAAFGTGRCDVWTLSAGHHYSLRLPSALFSDIAVSGKSLAITLSNQWSEASSRVEIVTWTLKDQRTSSSFVALPPKSTTSRPSLKMMLDSQGESLLLFEWVLNDFRDHGPTQFNYTRASLDGNVLTQGTLETPSTKDYHYCSEEAVPKATNGEAVIWAFIKRQRSLVDISELMLICYNFPEDRLEVHRQVVVGLCMNDKSKSSLFHWKSAAYFLQYEDSYHHLRVIDLVGSTCSEAEIDFFYSPLPFPEDEEPHTRLFGDETFLIAVFDEGFCVWCFDANLQIFNEDIHYKEKRKSNIAERRLLWEQDREKKGSQP